MTDAVIVAAARSPIGRAQGVAGRVRGARPEPRREGDRLATVSTLAPVFRPDGTVTAANACPLNDGAAAVVVMSSTRADELGLTPLARIVSTGVPALSPEIMGLGPIEASRRAPAHAGPGVSDIDLVEINEAFVAQVVPVIRDVGLDPDRVNVHGGAIALGHPSAPRTAGCTRSGR